MKYLLLTQIYFFYISCGGFKYKLINETEALKIYYIDSKKIGKNINAKLVIDDRKKEYNIYLEYAGMPLHIIRLVDYKNLEKMPIAKAERSALIITFDDTKWQQIKHIANR